MVRRVPLKGYAPAEVLFIRRYALLSGTTSYQIEFPGGAETKLWVPLNEVTPEKIRDECTVEYDGETLRVLGPGRHKREVPGFHLPKSP